MGREFLEDSICNDCKYLVSRIIKPHSLYMLLEDLGVPVDELELDLDSDGEIVFEHYMCRLLELELDHDVLECDGYIEKGPRGSIIKDRRFLDRI